MQVDLSGLECKLTAAKAAVAEIEASIKEVSYEAQVEGGEARKDLRTLQAQGVAADLEVKSLETAIAEAQRRGAGRGARRN